MLIGAGASNSQDHAPREGEKAQKATPPPCGRCGKPTDDARERFSSDGTILCFWCAYVETQG